MSRPVKYRTGSPWREYRRLRILADAEKVSGICNDQGVGMETIIQSNNPDFSDKLNSLRSTVRSLLRDVVIEAQPVRIDPDKGIDFYDNVTRYEIQLIRSALEVAGGRQNRAAELLNMRKSTLCSKIKQFKIKRL